jgi:hypothetical protein
MPSLKMHCLGWADPEQDSQYFRICHPLGQRRIEAGATLLNKGKVKAGYKRDRLKVVGLASSATARGVTIISWNCRPVLNPVGRIDRLGKHEVGIEIGFSFSMRYRIQKLVFHIELGEISEPQLSGRGDIVKSCVLETGASLRITG